MTSNDEARVFVWTWLPGFGAPVVAGAVQADAAGVSHFAYARSYRNLPGALALGPDLPLGAGTITPRDGLHLAGTLRDGLPDAWGQRVILDRVQGTRRLEADTASLADAVYMLESGSNRFGALDFQASATDYQARSEPSTLEEMLRAAEILDAGEELTPDLDAAANHGTSIGGARPKAQIIDADGRHWIAKFASTSDRLPVVQAEAAALDLAYRVGIDVPESRIEYVLGRPVLLIRRFDRTEDGGRLAATSMLSVLKLGEMTGRHATYPEFLDRLHGSPGVELFTRVAFNIAVGNTDDHARNHAALWDGTKLTLAPAYDLDPTPRPGGYDSNQAIAYSRAGHRRSNLNDLLGAVADYGTTPGEGRAIVDHVVDTVERDWASAAETAGLTARQAAQIRATKLLRELSLEGLSSTVAVNWERPGHASSSTGDRTRRRDTGQAGNGGKFAGQHRSPPSAGV